MKVSAVKTFMVHRYRTNWVFVKIETDEGISGIGEATLEMKERTVVAAGGTLRSAAKEVRMVPRDREI